MSEENVLPPTEIEMHAHVMGVIVEMLNTYGEFIDAPRASPQEDQLHKKLTDMVEAAEKNGSSSFVVMSLIDVIIKAGKPNLIQAYLNQVAEQLQEMMNEEGQ